MKKRQLIIISTVIIFLVIAVCAISIGHSYKRTDILLDQTRMFSSIDDFNKLNQYTLSKNIVDECLSDENVEQSFTGEIKYNDEEFSVYAYIFKSVDDMRNYRRKCLNEFQSLDIGWRINSNLTKTKYTVYYDTRLFRIECKNNSDIESFVVWLTEDFPIDINEKLDEYLVSGVLPLEK